MPVELDRAFRSCKYALDNGRYDEAWDGLLRLWKDLSERADPAKGAMLAAVAELLFASGLHAADATDEDINPVLRTTLRELMKSGVLTARERRRAAVCAMRLTRLDTADVAAPFLQWAMAQTVDGAEQDTRAVMQLLDAQLDRLERLGILPRDRAPSRAAR